MSLTSRIFALLCCLSFFVSSCITVPKIDGDMEAKLNKIQAAGKEEKNIKSPALAGALNIIPGVGQMYTGDYGDGVITLLFFWTVYHYVMGFVDAVQEARVRNATYTITFYEKKGFDFTLNLFDKGMQAKPKYALSLDQLSTTTNY